MVARIFSALTLGPTDAVLGARASRDARVRRAVRDYHAFLYRLIRRMGVSEADAEDAQQQVFCVYAKSLERIDAGCDKSFLFGVAFRVARTARRARLRHFEVVDEARLAQVPAPDRDAEGELDRCRARALLDALLAQMPDILRVVLVLHESRGVDHARHRVGDDIATRDRGLQASPAREALEQLVEAARNERLPAGNERRLLVALGLIGGGGNGKPGRPPHVTVHSWLRWASLGGLLFAACAGGALAAARHLPRLAQDRPAPPPTSLEREAMLAVTNVLLDAPSRPETAVATHRQPQPPTADDELAHVTHANLALRRADAAAALAALDVYARTFPRGAFREEAAALRVEALAVAARPEDAHSAADAFDRAYPQSAYAARVDRLSGPERHAPPSPGQTRPSVQAHAETLPWVSHVGQVQAQGPIRPSSSSGPATL